MKFIRENMDIFYFIIFYLIKRNRRDVDSVLLALPERSGLSIKLPRMQWVG